MTFLERMGFDVDVDIDAESSTNSIGIIIDGQEIARVIKSVAFLRVLHSSIIRGVSSTIGMIGNNDILSIITGDNGQAVLMTANKRFVISEFELILLCLAICREIELQDMASREELTIKGELLNFAGDKLKCYRKDYYLH